MRKFLAVVKREYFQRVRTKMFIAATILGPLVLSLFGVVPALIFSIEAGDAVRIAVVDQTGRMYSRLHKSIRDEDDDLDGKASKESAAAALNANSSDRIERAGALQEESFVLEEVLLAGRPIDQVKAELSERVRKQEIDGYLILPPNLLQNERAEFFGRNTGDVFTKGRLEDAVSDAVRAERLAEANIDVRTVRELSRPVKLQSFKIGDRGEERDSGEGFILVFAAGFVIYMTILMFGRFTGSPCAESIVTP